MYANSDEQANIVLFQHPDDLTPEIAISAGRLIGNDPRTRSFFLLCSGLLLNMRPQNFLDSGGAICDLLKSIF
jgi:hypothetical protein